MGGGTYDSTVLSPVRVATVAPNVNLSLPTRICRARETHLNLVDLSRTWLRLQRGNTTSCPYVRKGILY